MAELLLFCGWLGALCCLGYAAMPMLHWCWTARSPWGGGARILLVASAVLGVAVFANLALVRHDRQFDFTRERVYTADEQFVDVIDKLERRVRLTYFYRGDDPAGGRIRRILESLGRRSPMLEVITSDPDIDPSLARTAGVKLYNAALFEADGRRLIVQGTDQRELALGIQRLLGENRITVCFMTGHSEYPSTNEMFHTHVEALGGVHDHDHGANAVVETTAHGIGRLRRSLEALGHEVVEVSPAIDGLIDKTCRLLIDGGPRTPYSEIEVRALRDYLAGGGAALLLYDLDSEISPAQGAWLRELGIALPPAVVIDEIQHYAGDPEMVAATSYPPHPVTTGVSFSFFPGARALRLLPPVAGIDRSAIVTSSRHARVVPLRELRHHDEHSHEHADEVGHSHEHADEVEHSHVDVDEVEHSYVDVDELEQRPHADPANDASQEGVAIAAAVSGTSDPGGVPFRLVIVGDSDFASNSFYPYMSNSRLALAMIRWLLGEEEQAAIDARVNVRETIELTRFTQRWLFTLHVLVLPGLIAFVGCAVWWRRR